MSQEERPKFIVETERIYKSFETEIDILRKTKPRKKTDMFLLETIVAAYVKSYDFVLHICSLKDQSTSFFQLPMLRGVCEDLITLVYILKLEKPKQNYILTLKRHNEIFRATKAQKDFFGRYNKGQIVLPILNEGRENEIIDILKKEGHKFSDAKLPKVKAMANEIGKSDLYDFLYHATSKAVHFDILTLLSMGWGKINEDKGEIEPIFTYKNLYRHYYTFCLFYSSFLFIQQTKEFCDVLQLHNILEKLQEIEDGYKNIDWPEILTFGQMNIKEPSSWERITYRLFKTEIEE